jgi:hypothetical protein
VAVSAGSALWEGAPGVLDKGEVSEGGTRPLLLET